MFEGDRRVLWQVTWEGNSSARGGNWMLARRARLLSANTHTGGYLLLSFFAPVQVGTFFNRYWKVPFFNNNWATGGNFDVLFNNTVIGGYLPSVTAIYFQCAPTLRAVGALLRDTDTSNRLPLVNRAGASAFHLRPVDGMLLTVHEILSPMVSLRRITSSSV